MKLLIIDDDPHEIELMRLALWKDAEIHSAAGVIEGMSILAHETFDLCLVDLRLGVQSGLELVANCTATVPFIVLTNFPDDEKAMEQAAAMRGCLGFVAKDLAGSRDCTVHFRRLMKFAILKFHANQHE